MRKKYKSPVNINGALADKLKSAYASRGVNFIPQNAAKWALGMESDDLVAMADAEEVASDIEEVIKSTFEENELGDEFEDLTDAQIEAGVIAAQATADPEAYHTAATTYSAEGFGLDVGTAIDFRSTPSLEAFDSSNIRDYLHYSPVFNLKAARQDAFGEMFFPTITSTPDKAGYTVTIKRTMVHNEYNHIGDGKPAPETFMSKSLIDAAIDYRILANDSTRIYPLYSLGNEYLSENVGARTVELGNVAIKTAPLKEGKKVNLLSISQNPTLDPNGVNDVTDSLDGRIGLENIYLKVTGKDALDADKTSYIKMTTLNMPMSEFQKAAEGQDRDMALMFRTLDIPLHSGLKAVDNTTAEALHYLTDGARKNWVLRLAVNISGIANLEVGNVQVNASPVSIDSVWAVDVDGHETQVTDEATLDELKTKITAIEIDSYDLNARRSNINRRQRGLLVRLDNYTEAYRIALGSPITALKPITDTPTATDINGPIEAARRLNSNEAVTKLLEYSNTLDQYRVSMDRRTPVPRIEGIGRLLVRPYIDRIEFDLEAAIDSVSSHQRSVDVGVALVELIRDRITKASTVSGYDAAIELVGNPKPTVAIGTTKRISRYLMINGDTRTMSDAFKYQIETTPDFRMTDKIVITFIRPDVKEPDGLGFGNMIWIPELITDVPNSRGGAQAREFMVQPRKRHICHLPIMIVIDVKGLDKFTNERVGVKVVN